MALSVGLIAHLFAGDYLDRDGNQAFLCYSGVGRAGVAAKTKSSLVGGTGKYAGLTGETDGTSRELCPMMEGTTHSYSKAGGAPGKLRVGSPGVATILHLDLEALKVKRKVDITHVPSARGAESVPAHLGRHIEGLDAQPSEVLPHVQAGKIRVLAVYEDKRDPLLPDAPTFRELGHDVALGVYYLLIAPKGTAPAVVKTFHDAAKRALDEPVFVTMAKTRGHVIDYKGPGALRQELWDSYRKNETLLRKLGLGKK